MNELIAHNRNYNLRKPYSLEKEITTIKLPLRCKTTPFKNHHFFDDFFILEHKTLKHMLYYTLSNIRGKLCCLEQIRRDSLANRKACMNKNQKLMF